MNDEELYKQDIRDILTQALEGSKSQESVGLNFPVDGDLVEAGVDSLDLVELFLRLDDFYHIKIPQEEYQNLRSIDALAAFVSKCRRTLSI